MRGFSLRGLTCRIIDKGQENVFKPPGQCHLFQGHHPQCLGKGQAPFEKLQHAHALGRRFLLDVPVASLEQPPVEQYPQQLGKQLALQALFFHFLHLVYLKKRLPCLEHQFDLPAQVICFPDGPAGSTSLSTLVMKVL